MYLSIYREIYVHFRRWKSAIFAVVKAKSAEGKSFTNRRRHVFLVYF